MVALLSPTQPVCICFCMGLTSPGIMVIPEFKLSDYDMVAVDPKSSGCIISLFLFIV